MKIRTLGSLVSLLLLGTFIYVGISYAGDIKSRMKARLPVIKALKAKGVLGENNKGYLEFLKGNKENEEVIKAENADRQIVYKAIAKQQGAKAEVVGKRRALQIAEKAKPGEWIQGESGSWSEKK